MIQREPSTSRRGATSVEAAFVLGALILFVLALFDYGRYMMLRHLLDNAAREGVHLAVFSNPHDPNSFNYQTAATIQTQVQSMLAGQDSAISGLTIQVYDADANGNNIGSWTQATQGNNIAVQIDGTYQPLSPGMTLPIYHQWISLFPANAPLHSKCVMGTEAN